ncbi:MAG: lipid-A-disaccharide synthase [Rhodospirillaceae bacterium]|jgi:lipid-A-disaccharide synthase|nr:lipid-A-disaccharide synthase [Rhodospirillaceae bacterium]|tara:strand:- start:971 stop:2125 length:1155 start_codon:yes stop_codon:yes gene_type:complete
MLVAGEPSGDALGARLMAALRARDPDLEFIGVGGPGMSKEGLESLFPLSELAVMGLVEVLPRVPGLLARLRQTADFALAQRPEAVITIDAPGFNFRLGRRLQGQSVPLFHYVAPTVWAWRPGRAAKIARFLDHLLVLLPFEPPYFKAVGLDCSFVGHPAVETQAAGDGAAFRRRHGIAPGAPLLAVLPGSRHSETSRLLPIFEQTAEQLAKRFTDLGVVVPTVSTVAREVAAALARWNVPTIVVTEEAAKPPALAACNAALAASGTAVLELALAGVPSVAAYRINPLTHWLVRRMVRVEHASLVNLVLDRPVVPEFLQHDCRPELLVPAVTEILVDEGARRTQIEAAREAAEKLGAGGPPPSERAADVILSLLNKDPREGTLND